MATKVIKILNGNQNGTLNLSDGGHTKAKRLDTIIWQIRNNSGVQSIEAIEEKEDSYDIFATDPYQQGHHWRGEINGTAPDDSVYKYSIFWKDTNGNPHEYDPKISIKPSTLTDLIVKFAITLVVALLGLFTVKFLRSKRKSNK